MIYLGKYEKFSMFIIIEILVGDEIFFFVEFGVICERFLF